MCPSDDLAIPHAPKDTIIEREHEDHFVSEPGGSFSDFVDRLRVAAERDLEPFQRRDRFGALTGRAEGFSLFILESLRLLKDQAGLRRFGLTVNAHVAIEREAGQPTIVVSHEVKAIEEGLVREPIDIAAFYGQCFPFNTVMEGEFSISRQDRLAQRYFKALADKDIEERRAVLAIYCMHAADAFSIADLKVVPPPFGDSPPFITEPA